MTIDVELLRANTPGAERVIHFNNAGAALQSRATLQAVTDHLHREAEVGGYEAQAEAAERLAGAHHSLARLVGANRGDDVALVDSASRAWALVVDALAWSAGDRILTARSEYGSNAASLHRLRERHGVEWVLVDDADDGSIDVDALAALLDERVKLVSLTHVPGTNGVVQPLKAVGAALDRHPALFLLDAAQSAGQVPIDAAVDGVDVVIGTSRKFLRGPRGVGFLVACSDAGRGLVPSFPQLASASDISASGWVMAETVAARFESWEGSIAARLGLANALDEALALGVASIDTRISALAGRLRAGLSSVGAQVHDRGDRTCGIVTFTASARTSHDVVAALRAGGVNTSVSASPSAPFDPDGPGWTRVRASVHAYNTEHEVDRVVDLVGDLR